jgi:hypothetical protein
MGLLTNEKMNNLSFNYFLIYICIFFGSTVRETAHPHQKFTDQLLTWVAANPVLLASAAGTTVTLN